MRIKYLRACFFQNQLSSVTSYTSHYKTVLVFFISLIAFIFLRKF